ncbi:stage III sporulation protein AE [Clostridium grantii]|uniref:stage III sporulation protein AE n=1 Tax=Clostridium grantii TaxID=40575 RepID=UPI0009354121|nr:stage III sporulation protein AE [Clostridium grantii]
MKKILFCLSLVFMMNFFFVSNCYGDDNTYGVEESDTNNAIKSLYQYMTNIQSEYEMLRDMTFEDYVTTYTKTGQGALTFDKFIEIFLKYGLREITATFKTMSTIIVIAIICALIKNLETAFSNENLSNIAYFACYSLIIIILAKSFYNGVTLARETIQGMSDFMTALIPVLLMLLAGVGSVTEAAVLDPIIIGTVNISAKLIVDILLPIISFAFVLIFVNNISEDSKIENLTKLLNQIVLWLQGIIMTVFIGIITIRGISANTIDAVAEKTVKFAVDKFIPIVGGALSDAISTVAGYSLLIKNALSSVGLIVLIAIVLIPIIKLLAIGFIYKITAALIEPISDKRLVKSVSAAGDSLILITSCLISVSVMFFIMIAIVASAGKIILNG